MPKPINHRERIDLDDNMMNMMVKMVEGNPGAINVCMQLLADKNDPDSFLGGMGNILSLDTHGIYGSNIWVLFKNVCGQNILNVVTVLRAVQLGLYSESDLWNCIDNCTVLDCEQLRERVKQIIPNFAPQQIPA